MAPDMEALMQLAMVGSVAGTGEGGGRQDLLLCGSIGSLATPTTVFRLY